MFSSGPEGSVIEAMAKEIVRECSCGGTLVSLNLAVYLANLKVLSPRHGCPRDADVSGKFAKPIVEECVRHLTDDPIWINTLKMEAHLERHVLDRDKARREHEDNMEKKSRPLMKEIIEVDASDRGARYNLYGKIVAFTIAFSGLGDPGSSSHLKEAQAALQSIFRHSDLERFIFHTDNMKEEQLMEITRIANGIRLFNKDCQKGGQDIDDLPLILRQASQITKERIANVFEHLKTRISQLTSVLDVVYSLSKRNCDDNDDVKPNIPSECSENDVDTVKRVLYLMTECEYYMKRVFHILEDTDSTIMNIIKRFRKTLLELHDIVRYRSAVPTVQVYPLFIVLSRAWMEMQKEAYVLTEVNSVITYLHSFTKFDERTHLETMLDEVGKSDSSPDLSSIDNSNLYKGVTVVHAADIKDINEIQLRGYCAWTLAVTDGVLFPCNMDIGFLQHRGRIYAFSSVRAANAWGRNPDRFMIKLYRSARVKLELIKILNIYDDLDDLKTDMLSDSEPGEITRNNVEIQTEVHPIETHLDRDYIFSLWEFKRKAVHISHTIKYKTKSQQTMDQSVFRCNSALQANTVESRSTQTKRDSSSNTSSVTLSDIII